MASIPRLNAVVIQRDEMAPRLMIFRVEPDSRDLSHLKEGLYVQLGRAPTAKRYVLSAPEGTHRLGITSLQPEQGWFPA